jgi:hypothetical protein
VRANGVRMVERAACVRKDTTCFRNASRANATVVRAHAKTTALASIARKIRLASYANNAKRAISVTAHHLPNCRVASVDVRVVTQLAFNMVIRALAVQLTNTTISAIVCVAMPARRAHCATRTTLAIRPCAADRVRLVTVQAISIIAIRATAIQSPANV